MFAECMEGYVCTERWGGFGDHRASVDEAESKKQCESSPNYNS